MSEAARRPARPAGSLRAEDQSNGWHPLAIPSGLVEHLADLIADRLAAKQPEPIEPYLTVEQAAEYLAAPKSRVYELIERQRVAVHRDGRRLLFRRADLDAALKREGPRP